MDEEEKELLKSELQEELWSLVEKYINQGLDEDEAWTTVEEAAANVKR